MRLNFASGARPDPPTNRAAMPARDPLVERKAHTSAAGVPVPVTTAPTAKPSGLAGLGKIRKTIAALIGANATWATAALTPNAHVTIPEWIALGIANATALGVYSVANNPQESE